MEIQKKHAFFLKNGKELKNKVISCFHNNKESINSLFDQTETVFIKKESLKTNAIYKIQTAYAKVSKHFKPTHYWMVSSLGVFIAVTFMFLIFPWKVHPVQKDKYSIYASTPLTLKDMDYSIYTRDSRAQKINAVFKKYKCPMEGLGDVFVYEADKYNIPWWLVASVSFQESGCGKKTPEVSGLESYNAWGWAVYGSNVQTFDNWVRGIETVSEYMSEKFFKKGITDTCEIMKVYTPPSQGSWCEGVSYFGQEIQNYTSADDAPDTIR